MEVAVDKHMELKEMQSNDINYWMNTYTCIHTHIHTHTWSARMTKVKEELCSWLIG